MNEEDRQDHRAQHGNRQDSQWADSTVVQLRFSLPMIYVAKIIGKKGENIKRVTKESGAQVAFGDNLPPARNLGSDLQECSVKGNTEQVEKAVVLVCQECAGFDRIRREKFPEKEPVTRASPGEVMLSLIVPGDVIPRIIGKKGAKIKEIQAISSTVMDVQEEDIYGEKYLTFTGVPERIAVGVITTAKGLPVETWEPRRMELSRGPPERRMPSRERYPDRYEDRYYDDRYPEERGYYEDRYDDRRREYDDYYSGDRRPRPAYDDYYRSSGYSTYEPDMKRTRPSEPYRPPADYPREYPATAPPGRAPAARGSYYPAPNWG